MKLTDKPEIVNVPAQHYIYFENSSSFNCSFNSVCCSEITTTAIPVGNPTDIRHPVVVSTAMVSISQSDDISLAATFAAANDG